MTPEAQNAVTRLLREIPPGHYGGITEGVRSILSRAERGAWLRGDGASASAVCEALRILGDRLERLGAVEAGAAFPGKAVEELRGCSVLERALERVSFDVERPAEPWRAVPLRLLEARREKVRLEGWFRSRLRGPLWIVPGDSMIYQPLAAFQGTVDALEADEDCRERLWLLLCQIEHDLWHALLWEFTGLAEQTLSPYAPLMEVYAQGFVPLGFDGDRFLVWTLQ